MPIETQGNSQDQHSDTPKAPALGEQQTTEQSGNRPPLHPVWERVAQTLAKQQEAAELDKKEGRRAYKRDWMRQWRKEHPDKHQENRMRNYRRRMKEAQLSEQPGASPDPSVMPPAPEKPTPAHPHPTRGRKNPRV
jgi:hypothetical protein